MGRTESILVIEAPPRHGKSELCCKYLPAWYLGTFPERRVMLAMHSQALAHDYGRKARDVMEQHGNRCFGVRVRTDSKAADNWNLEGHDGGMITAGVGTGIGGRGADLLIIDDPVSGAEAAMSERQREKNWDWWQSEALARVEPGGVVIVIGTRWHEDDLSGRLIRNAGVGDGIAVRRLHLKAIASDGDVLGRQAGEALWPHRFPISKLEELKQDKSSYWWNALYQQAPSRHEGAEWPEEYFDEHLWSGHWPDAFDLKAMAIDPSKGRQRGDFSAIVTCGLSGGLLWVDASLERRPVEKIVSDAIDMALPFQPHVINVEGNQFQDVAMGNEFTKQCMERRIAPMPLWTPENRDNKEERISRLGPHLSRKLLRFRDTAGCRRLVQQLKEFPLSDHDDGPDALEMVIRTLGSLSASRQQPAETEYEQVTA